MKYLNIQDVMTLHQQMIEAMQGLKGVNPQQIELLESALQQIQNDDYYPNFIDKLTHIVFACVKFHPFLDGNKRTALLVARTFIVMNYPKILPENFYQNLEDVVVAVAEGKTTKEELREILQNLLRTQ
ncbi:type II toxin-antitoxin system death-on-curing family toxin [uncultured Helicobacter sp.]|uniref:type II toxin-antitoxin system death-on-curing family toxin n=1 Tax=uncultured Helicobacter sp. TaxID=175537 RepID=UPI002614F057|nr:type II toxin-antitoxin system death-on-curing family toxin [uncultured Helicobacter sp.]